ncbi:MAG: hypothetical protein ACOX37_06950 [Bacillota bacterium]
MPSRALFFLIRVIFPRTNNIYVMLIDSRIWAFLDENAFIFLANGYGKEGIKNKGKNCELAELSYSKEG